MHEKWSTTILKELMELAGGDPWRKWKVESASAGVPLVPGEENEHRIIKRSSIPLPSLKVFRASRPVLSTPESESQQTSKEEIEEASLRVLKMEMPTPPPVPKTGVSAALP